MGDPGAVVFVPVGDPGAVVVLPGDLVVGAGVAPVLPPEAGVPDVEPPGEPTIKRANWQSLCTYSLIKDLQG